jgi:phytoene dehydrogenase-like protein
MSADAVVIGAGPNGLVAANQLADAGWSVEVLEAADEPGGGVRSGPSLETGFTTDHCSAFYPFGAVAGPLADLGLEEHGLRWCHSPTVLAHPALDGTCPVLSRDLDATVASLETFAPGDGEAWRRLYQRFEALQPHLLQALYGPFPPVRSAAAIAARLGPAELARLARFLVLPVRRLGQEEFRSDQARRLLAGAALHADLAPETPPSGFMGWLLCVMGQAFGFPVPQGGAQAITTALVDRLEARGGVVRCGVAVDRVLVEHGRATGVRAGGETTVARHAVLADVSAPALYHQLLAGHHLPTSLLRDLDRFDWDHATFKVDWTLDGPIPWSAPAARSAATVHVAESTDSLTVSSGELARDLIPSTPFLLIGQMAVADPTRQPAGRDTAWAYTHVPRQATGDGAGVLGTRWSPDDVACFTARIEDQIEALAPGFRSRIRVRRTLAPNAFEAANANMVGGSINGGTSQMHQQLIFRPTPGLGRASTPIDRLYLASSSAHPGGGVHGAPGSHAARAALGGALRWRRRSWRP